MQSHAAFWCPSYRVGGGKDPSWFSTRCRNVELRTVGDERTTYRGYFIRVKLRHTGPVCGAQRAFSWSMPGLVPVNMTGSSLFIRPCTRASRALSKVAGSGLGPGAYQSSFSRRMFRNVAVNNNDGDVALCYTVEFSTVPVQKNKVLL
jgi:hypothetical protein